MSSRINKHLKAQDSGLTVGELTMAIGALIIIGLIWTTLAKRKESKNSHLIQFQSEPALIVNKSFLAS